MGAGATLFIHFQWKTDIGSSPVLRSKAIPQMGRMRSGSPTHDDGWIRSWIGLRPSCTCSYLDSRGTFNTVSQPGYERGEESFKRGVQFFSIITSVLVAGGLL